MKTVPAENYFSLFESNTVYEYLDCVRNSCAITKSSFTEIIYVPFECINYSYGLGIYIDTPMETLCVPEYVIDSDTKDFSGIVDNNLVPVYVSTNGVTGEQSISIAKYTLQRVINSFHKTNIGKFRNGDSSAYVSYEKADDSEYVLIDSVIV